MAGPALAIIPHGFNRQGGGISVRGHDRFGLLARREISPQKFREDLLALGDIDKLAAHLNSEGRYVFKAQSPLKRHPAQANAASAATLIMAVGDKVTVPRGSI